MHQENPTVAHYVRIYLPLTGSWIHNQLRHLTHWRPVVLCDQIERLDIFPFDPIYSPRRLAKPAHFYQRVMRRLQGYEPFFGKTIRREQVNVLHAHFGHDGYRAMPLAKAYKVPMITTYYGADLSRLPKTHPEWRQRYHQLFEVGSLFLVEGPHMRQQLIELGCPPDKVCVQRLGIDVDDLSFHHRKPDADGTVRILASATFTEKKGLTYALEAFARAFQRHKNIRLTVIGDARPDHAGEQAVKKRLYEIVETNRLTEVVDFMGYQPHPVLIEAFQRHHILISPSVHAQDGNNEGGSPVTITEATATGMPILSTHHCDIPAVVLDGESGFLVAERDVEALTERLESLITNPELWPRMGEAGRRHVEENFNAHRQAQLLEAHYARVSH
jgi:colanic acid/amylovoran biosynthesis glycosyltransferase